VGNMYWPTALTKPVQKYSRRLCYWIRTQFTALSSGFFLASVPAFVWQHRQKFSTTCLVPLLCFLWSGFVELSVNNSSIACAMKFELPLRSRRSQRLKQDRHRRFRISQSYFGPNCVPALAAVVNRRSEIAPSQFAASDRLDQNRISLVPQSYRIVRGSPASPTARGISLRRNIPRGLSPTSRCQLFAARLLVLRHRQDQTWQGSNFGRPKANRQIRYRHQRA